MARSHEQRMTVDLSFHSGWATLMWLWPIYLPISSKFLSVPALSSLDPFLYDLTEHPGNSRLWPSPKTLRDYRVLYQQPAQPPKERSVERLVYYTLSAQVAGFLHRPLDFFVPAVRRYKGTPLCLWWHLPALCLFTPFLCLVFFPLPYLILSECLCLTSLILYGFTIFTDLGLPKPNQYHTPPNPMLYAPDIFHLHGFSVPCLHTYSHC